MKDQKAFIVGISGCSSSGKTTLARLLRDIFPASFILHEDDFYKPEEELPKREGLVDWDSIASLSIPDMQAALTHIHSVGTFPPELDSKEDQNSVGKCPVDANDIAAQKLKVQQWLKPGSAGDRIFRGKDLKICFLDGFLLYNPDLESVMKLLDLRVFLLASRAKAIERRAARDGYVTLEGFWKDPPGYVEKVVWPNYVEAHSWLFKTGDVEGDLNAEVLAANKIEAQIGQGLDVPMSESLKWVVDLVIRGLEDLHLSSSQHKR